ncbi:MAG TPA: Arc family DNA-binding protein [Gemmatimonadaceae bacterium]|nr:Arc family DNA-binding protein [Gemmatimonadaceae bacterium]
MEPTMPTLTLKNLPDRVYTFFKERAASNRRSLNSEILVRLEQAMLVEHVEPAEARERLARADAVRERLERRGVTPLTDSAIRSARKHRRP